MNVDVFNLNLNLKDSIPALLLKSNWAMSVKDTDTFRNTYQYLLGRYADIMSFTDLLHCAKDAAYIGEFDLFRELHSLVLRRSKELTEEQWIELGNVHDLSDQLTAIATVLSQCDDDTVPAKSSQIFSNFGCIVKSTQFQLKRVDSDDIKERDKYIAEFLDKAPLEMKDPFKYAIKTTAGEGVFDKMGCVYSICYPLTNVLGNQTIKMTGILKRNILANMEYIECNSTKSHKIGNDVWWQYVSCGLQRDASDSPQLRGMFVDRRLMGDSQGSNLKEVVKAMYLWELKVEEITD